MVKISTVYAVPSLGHLLPQYYMHIVQNVCYCLYTKCSDNLLDNIIEWLFDVNAFFSSLQKGLGMKLAPPLDGLEDATAIISGSNKYCLTGYILQLEYFYGKLHEQ